MNMNMNIQLHMLKSMVVRLVSITYTPDREAVIHLRSTLMSQRKQYDASPPPPAPPSTDEYYPLNRSSP